MPKRTRSWALIVPALFAAVAPVQTVTAGFQFPATVKPGDELTVPETGLATITGVALKTAGKPDIAATNGTTAAASLKFTVPPATPNGNYTVVLTPGSLAPIPLTIATPPPPGSGTNAPAPPAAPAPALPPPPAAPDVYMPDGQLKSHAVVVYIARNIELEQQPCLRLNRSHELTKAAATEDQCHPPLHVASGQK